MPEHTQAPGEPRTAPAESLDHRLDRTAELVGSPAPMEPSAAGVRNLDQGDLAACLALDRQALGGLWTEAQWRRELQEPARPGVGLWQRDLLLAMASGWLVVDELHITLVAVDPLHRRRGLGSTILAALMELGRCSGAHHATLEVAASNGAAQALYAGAGFREAGVRRGYYRNGDDALIQWVRLTP